MTEKEYIKKWNSSHYNVYSIPEYKRKDYKFSVGNLVVQNESKGIKNFYNKYLLIVGIVFFQNDAYSNNVHYLVKISNTTKPTFTSKGHYLMILHEDYVKKNYYFSLKNILEEL